MKIEQIIINCGLTETNKTIGLSFAIGCKVWKVKDKEIYLTDYDINDVRLKKIDLRKENELLLYTPNKGYMYIWTFELTEQILNDKINKFDKCLKDLEDNK